VPFPSASLNASSSPSQPRASSRTYTGFSNWETFTGSLNAIRAATSAVFRACVRVANIRNFTGATYCCAAMLLHKHSDTVAAMLLDKYADTALDPSQFSARSGTLWERIVFIGAHLLVDLTCGVFTALGGLHLVPTSQSNHARAIVFGGTTGALTGAVRALTRSLPTGSLPSHLNATPCPDASSGGSIDWVAPSMCPLDGNQAIVRWTGPICYAYEQPGH
jgi:hypothetical protein